MLTKLKAGYKIMDGFKINLHITEKCNYHCGYCFAHFRRKKDLPLQKWFEIIDNLKASGNISAINFAGGEPVLYKDFLSLVGYAKRLGFPVSIISNGSLLLNEKLMPVKTFSQIETLGISTDSFDKKRLISLGCCDGAFRVLTKERLKKIIERAKSVNPTIKIKLNTVVSRLNLNEEMTNFENEVEIDRWKFLKIKPFENNHFSNKYLTISDAEFQDFIARNPVKNGTAVQEFTTTRSYIIIDNEGNLLDNFGDSYDIVGNLLEENFSEVFSRYQFDKELYNSRYQLTA